ncbi:MAG: MFS transporter, partial [Microbacterium sp. 14-71-5]
MTRTATLGTLVAVVGFLAFVEFTSGVLQGYYTPMLSDIARHLGIHDADVNWFEGAQLMLSALVVPAFAKLGDMIGRKRMLLISTAITAVAAFVLPFT